MARSSITKENHIWYELRDEARKLSHHHGVSNLEIMDALVASIKFVLGIQVFMDGDRIITQEGEELRPRRMNKIERRFRYELEHRTTLKKYRFIKKYLLEHDNVIEATVISNSKNVAILSWEGLVFSTSGDNFFFLRKKPEQGDTVRIKVVKTTMNLKRMDEPITLEVSTRNKEFLQKEITKACAISGLIISHIDIKKVYVSSALTLTTSDIEAILTKSPYRTKLNHVAGIVSADG